LPGQLLGHFQPDLFNDQFNQAQPEEEQLS
jgi:hypothetical protein